MNTITHFFSEQAVLSGNKVAIYDHQETISFEDLDKKSNEVAQHILEALKNNRNYPTIIGLCLSRNIKLVIGLLGILKAGCAFVPLDPIEPPSRLKFMLKDTRSPLVLTDIETLATHPWLTEYSDIILDDLKPIDIPQTLPIVTPTDPAYLIYTSGSTGEPKGVLCPHQAVINRFEWLWKNHPYSASDVCCQKAPISYVDSIWELLCPLLKGVPYYFISNEILFNTIKLLEFLAQHKVTRIDLVPSLLEVILQELQTGNFALPTLNFWVASGEMLPPHLVNLFKQVLPNAILLNRYGSTEATSYLWYPAYLWDNESQNIPIGKPIQNTVIHILNEELEPVSRGEIGELFVGGLCLSYGYINAAKLNTQKFIVNPFALSDSRNTAHISLLYKTGDLVRELPSGNLEYMGRVDHQIKIHGFRIEPVEIENALLQHRSINSAKVILQILHNDPYLTAYYIAEQPHVTLSNSEIKAHLEKLLPPQMIPNFYIALEKFPLNKSGKLNRSALPKPNIHEHKATQELSSASFIEATLLTLWKNILKTDDIHLNDNFFALGGHSILAMQMIAEIYRTLDVTLKITDIWHQPTIKDLATFIQSLKKPDTQTNKITIDSQHLPLSVIEQELWFLNHFEQIGGSSYHTNAAIELEGHLNYDALNSSINYLVQHHSILRTTYIFQQEIFFRKIIDYVQFDLPVIPIESNNFEDQIQKYIAVPFNLEKDVLFRAFLFKKSTNSHVLLIIQHHIITDDGSFSILLKQLSLLYNQYIKGLPQHISIEKPYFEYALWQRQQIKEKSYNKQLSYWYQALSNSEPMNIISDFHRPDIRTTYGSIYRFTIADENVNKLQNLTRMQHTTLFISLLSVTAILLSRYSQQNDIIIGTPISLRDNPIFSGTLGLLLNSIVLKLKLEPILSFLDILKYVKGIIVEALENKDAPFPLVVRELNLENTPGNSPLFNILFVYQDYDVIDNLQLDDLYIKNLDIHNQRAKYDLSFYFDRNKEKINGKIEFSHDLFKIDSITEMAKSFNSLLTNILNTPDQPIRSHSLLKLNSVDYTNIVIGRNQTAFPIPPVAIHQLFEKQVDISPHAIAIEYQNQTLTYAELNSLANQIAAVLLTALKEKNLTSEPMIAICLEHSPIMIAMLLAIFKSGCGYVPFDTNYPYLRIENIIQQLQPLLFICSEQVIAKHPQIKTLKTMVVPPNDILARASNQNKNNPNIQIDPRQLAQIIYTSGSTGKPKGVMLEHKGIVNRLLWMQSEYQLTSEDKFLHKTPYIFDVSVGEIFWPLASGARLVISEEGSTRDFSYLANLIKMHHVTHIHFIPSAIPIFLDIIKNNNQDISSLKCIFCSGEALSTAIEYAVLTTLDVSLHNIYGPTEAGEVSYYPCKLNMHSELSTRPIGKPIHNTRLYILDSELNPVPVNVPGELYIGGDCLARGYYQQPELTHQRFFNCMINNEEERLYKTSDIAYWLHDSNIAYLGRDDLQVKIRGNRIELEEIENIISGFSGVKQCILTVKTIQMEKHLVAYYITDENASLQPEKISTMLKKQVPEYMVPSYIIPIEKFPLTASGKIDRKALPTPDFTLQTTEITPPQDKIEYDLLLLWQQVLPETPINTQDNFFMIGGHSLLAIHLISKINTQFKRQYPLTWIFNLNTIQKQAEAIRASLSGDELYQPMVCYNPGIKTRLPVIFIHPGRAGAEAYINMALLLDKEIPFYVLESHNIYRDNTIFSIEELATQYLSIIKKTIPSGPYYLGGWSLGGLIAYEMAQQLSKTGEPIEELLLIDSSTHLSDMYTNNNELPKKYLDFLDTLTPEIRSRYNQVIRIENDMMTCYRPAPYDGRVTLFQASQALHLADQQWLGLVKKLIVYNINTSHFSIMEPPMLQNITDYINKNLGK